MMMEPDEAFPPYAFVPGGPWPHPTRTPAGHSFLHKHDPKPEPIDPAHWEDSREYLHGIRLFNGGYYWEAHEAWEGLWHAAGRRGPIADLLKALIKLAAAGVKVRERQSSGVATHAGRAAFLFQSIQTEIGPTFLGLNLRNLAEIATKLAASPPKCDVDPAVRVHRVFEFEIRPISDIAAIDQS